MNGISHLTSGSKTQNSCCAENLKTVPCLKIIAMINATCTQSQAVQSKGSRLKRLLLPMLFLARGVCPAVPTPPPGFRHFDANDGLPSSEVYEVLQDPRLPLVQYRQRASAASTDSVSRTSAPCRACRSLIFNLQEDRQGRIWMQGMSGRLYHLEQDSVHAFAGNRLLDSLVLGRVGAIEFLRGLSGPGL